MEDILQFFSDNKDALTAIGIILTFLVSITSLYFSARNNKAVHYVNAITKSRVEWIQKLRDLVAICISKCSMKDNQILSDKALGEMQQYILEIKLMLNFDGQIDKKIISILELLDEKTILLRDWNNYYSKYKYKDEEVLLDNFSELAHKTYFVGEYVLRKSKEFGIDYSSKTQSFCRDTYIERFMREIKKSEDSYKRLVLEFSWEMENTIEVIQEILADFEKYIQIYLKSEWNRVKYESQGKTYEKIVQDFDLGELKEKYDNPGYKNKIWKRRFIVLWAKIKKLFPICIVVDFLSFIGAKFKRG